MKLSIKLDFVLPLESPPADESGFSVTVDRSTASPAGLGPTADVLVWVGTGSGVGSGAGVRTDSGFDGIGGGETNAVLSAFSFARASAAASLSAFCCFRMRSTTKSGQQAQKMGRSSVITVVPSSP